jgi:poly-gamma-glutamate synthesis protein (capsule biosynthesis protein)
MLARRMIDAGASLVVGGHPHVIQDAELYRGKLIVHSLGNFVFDGFDLPEERQGWLLRLEVDRRGLKAWQTRLVQIDAAGTPVPVSGAETPCGRRGRGDRRLPQSLRARAGQAGNCHRHAPGWYILCHLALFA